MPLTATVAIRGLAVQVVQEAVLQKVGPISSIISKVLLIPIVQPQPEEPVQPKVPQVKEGSPQEMQNIKESQACALALPVLLWKEVEQREQLLHATLWAPIFGR